MKRIEARCDPHHADTFRDDELELPAVPPETGGCGSGSCSCGGGRRNFFKGLLSGGLAALSGGTAGAAENATTATSATPTSNNQKVKALLPNGQLIELDMPDMPTHAHLPPTDPAVRRGMVGRRWTMVIDLAKCDGCGACAAACSKMHHTPPDRQWIKVLRMQDDKNHAPYWFPKPCFHCDNPPCTKVCPVDATFKREDGIVLIDNERCIGCRFCMAACPYSTRSFNWGPPQESDAALTHEYSPETGFPRKMGTVEKCDFCPDMAARGLLPVCVTNCPMGAIYYGDENEDAVTNAKGETERLSKLLADRSAYRYMEELGTKPRVHYLPPVNRQYPSPSAPESAAHQQKE